MLQDLDPEEFPDSPTLLLYCPLRGDIWVLKLRSVKTDYAPLKLVSITKHDSVEQPS